MRPLLLAVLLLAVGCKSFSSDPGGTDTPPETDGGAADAPCPNGALSFTGKSFVNVEYSDLFDSPSDLSVEAWINPSKDIADREVDIVSHHDDTNSDGWVLSLHGGVVFSVYSGSGKGSAAGGTLAQAIDDSLTYGAWHHVAAVFDGAAKTITIFIDGKSKGRNPVDKSKADPYNGPLTIGAAAYLGANGYVGIIDEILVSKKVRHPSADTFKPVYPLPDGEDGTVGTWHFIEGKAPAEVVNEATGKFKSTLATFATPTPEYPTPVVAPMCPTGARP